MFSKRYDSFKDRWLIEKDGRFFASFLFEGDCEIVYGLLGGQ